MWRSLPRPVSWHPSSIALLRWGQAYVDEGMAGYESRYRSARIHRLEAAAKQLGYKLAPQTTAANRLSGEWGHR